MSKEHIWPKWSANIVPAGEGYGVVAGAADKRDRTSAVHHDYTRQGGITSFKVRRVCTTCNNGWMAKYEQEIRSILERMILGRNVHIDESQCRKLSEYLFYKILILDHAFEQFAPNDFFHKFYEHRIIPENVTMFLLNCIEGTWRSGIRIMGGHFAAEIPDPKAPPNVRTIALGFGNLFVYCVLRKGGIFDPIFTPGVSFQLHPLFHPSMRWPPLSSISSDVAETISMTIWHGGMPTVGDDFSGFPVFGRMVKA